MPHGGVPQSHLYLQFCYAPPGVGVEPRDGTMPGPAGSRRGGPSPEGVARDDLPSGLAIAADDNCGESPAPCLSKPPPADAEDGEGGACPPSTLAARKMFPACIQLPPGVRGAASRVVVGASLLFAAAAATAAAAASAASSRRCTKAGGFCHTG